MARNVIIASLLRTEGETGVQTHTRVYRRYREAHGLATVVVTPYDVTRWLVYPAFAVRRFLQPCSKAAGVWWYREVHGFFLWVALRRALRSGAPATIYAQCPVSAGAALRARQNHDQRVVLAAHFNVSQADEWVEQGFLRNENRVYRRIREFEARTLTRLDGLVCVSQFMHDQLRARIPGIEAVRTTVIPNFLDDPRKIGSVGSVNLGGSATRPRAGLISIGSLEPRKNLEYAVRIVAASRRLGRPLPLTIVGDGPERHRLEALSAELGVADLVVFAGFVPHAADLVCGFVAYLHTSKMENLPFVLIEAMSRSTPVFAGAVGGIPEVFVDGAQGRVIPLDEPDEAAAIIIASFDDAGLLERYSASARRRFLERFESEGVAGRLTRFLEDNPTAHVA